MYLDNGGATLVRVRCCLLSASCLLNPRGYRFLATFDADKAFLVGHSELYCKPLAVLLFAVSIFGILALLHLFTNLYFLFIKTCSVFGEDALVNVSVEKKEDNDGKLAGYIRIRSKTQGIALSLGDRITSVQRGLKKV